MKSRCFNKNRNRNKNYILRGITVCERWRKSFAEFLKDMGERPENTTLDRVDNNGNYSCGKCEQCIQNSWPMNCRWATNEQQANNRIYRSNKTGYTGVSERKGRFYARATVNGEWKNVGGFSTPEEAHQAYLENSDKFIKEKSNG
jgi:hypothetical protein